MVERETEKPALPSLVGRYFNVGLCCACWDRLNPERKLEPERRAQMESEIAETWSKFDKGDIVVNRCAACEETVHAGILVRVNLERLREMRPKS